MIALPPGCKVAYSITIDIDELTEGIVDWFDLIGGKVTADEFVDWRGNTRIEKYVQYGKGKRCYRYQNPVSGHPRVRLHFAGEDATVASMFILKFLENVKTHNLKEREYGY
jgi:prenyltransferase beta subunit